MLSLPARPSGGHLAVMAGVVAALSALAFFLAPAGHLNTTAIVQINGLAYSVPTGTKISDLAEVSALLARPGSTLDLTGDVTAIGDGSAALRLMGSAPLSEDLALGDGAEVLVRHGEHVLESIERVTKEIPVETTVTGKGNIVTLVQRGAPGLQEIFRGTVSKKQAATFIASPAQRTVLQRSKTPVAGQKLAALTFDDGPGTHTQKVLDALATAHVPATFFVLGSSASGSKAMIEKMRAAGHEVENHTWSHPDLTKVSTEEFRRQVSRTNAVVGATRFLRPPYGSSNDSVKAQTAAMGLRLAFWTVDTLDWRYQDLDSIVSRVKAATKPGAIILMHDGGTNQLQTVAAIPVVVDWLFDQGYSLTVVDQIL